MLKKRIEELFIGAFHEAYPELNVSIDQIEVTRSTHPRFGQYQCNTPMKLAKVAQCAPRDIAHKIVSVLNEHQSPILASLEVAGPGFINISLNPQFLSEHCNRLLKDPKLGVIEEHNKIVIDFPSVNAAKEMHVGHLRSAIIGDCLARIFEFSGNDVLRLNHLGDWGTSFGMLIAYIKKFEPAVLADPPKANLTLLVKCYRAGKKLFDEDPQFKKMAQQEVVTLQQGEPDALKAWSTICAISRVAHDEVYNILDVSTIERGESFYNPYLAEVVSDLDTKGLLELSDGAKCMFLEGFENRDGEALPLMLQKSDGGFNYSTTDLTALKHRIEIEKADKILYIVDAGQSMHFSMVFSAGEKAGYLDPQKTYAHHVGFGVVLGPDGKKFKTRSGETERLIDLLNTAIEKANRLLTQRNEEGLSNFTSEEIEITAKRLGINALKYADLSCNRINDYVFSYDRMLTFEGNTAAFLMYSYVRIQGIKRKVQDADLNALISLEHTSEIALGLHLCQFSDTLDSVCQDLMPNRLCDYLYELSEKFNAFFRDCRVQGVSEQNARLALCELSARILHQGMNLLGLQTVDKM